MPKTRKQCVTILAQIDFRYLPKEMQVSIFCLSNFNSAYSFIYFLFVGNVFKTEVVVPWEYNATFPLRSTPVMYLLTSVPFSFLKSLSVTFGHIPYSPYVILVFPRLIICTLSFVSDFCLYRICYLYGQNFKRRLLLYASSYVTICYGTRTFSNTVEMVLFNILLYLVAVCMAESEKVWIKQRLINFCLRTCLSRAEHPRITLSALRHVLLKTPFSALTGYSLIAFVFLNPDRKQILKFMIECKMFFR